MLDKVKMIVIFPLTLALLSPFTKELFTFLMDPFSHIICTNRQFLSVAVTSPVMVPIKILLFCSFLLSLPFNLYILWRFVSSGLYQKENQLTVMLALISVLMFLCGLTYCYYVVFPLVFSFIDSFSPDSVQFAPDISESLGFILQMFIAFGFEIPVIVFF